jgi:hypothetical protein
MIGVSRAQDAGSTHLCQLTWQSSASRTGYVSAVTRATDSRSSPIVNRPGSIFAFVRWAASDFGTIISRIDIVRTVPPATLSTLPFVRPGGDPLRVDAWPKVERVCRRSTRWSAGRRPRTLLGLLAARPQPAVRQQTPRATPRHQAWLKRREVSP